MGVLNAEGWEIEKIALDLIARNQMGLLEFSNAEQVVNAAIECMEEHFPDWEQREAAYWVMVGAAAGAAMIEKQWLDKTEGA